MVSIFDTTLTLAELEKALQQSLSTKSKLGCNAKFEELGDGNGVITQVGLLTADWTPTDPLLPLTFAVKVSAPKTATKENQLAELMNETMSDEKAKSMIKYHNTEVDIYEKFKEHDVVLLMPKMYACKKRERYEDAGYIILEHYEEIASGIHMNDNVSSRTVKTIIEELVKIHNATKYFSQEEQNKMKGQMFQDTFQFMFTPEMVTNLTRLMKEFGGDYITTEVLEMETVLTEMTRPEYLKFLDDTCEALGLPRLLCHGDVWMCNMLWETKQDQLELRSIIDFQGVQFNCPAADLIRLFTGCLSGKDRRENWEEYTKYWCQLMTTSEETFYTLEQITEAYYRLFPGCAFIVAGSIAAVGQMIIDKQLNEEKKLAAKKSLEEKQLALLQDIIFCHKRNMDLIHKSQ